MSLQKSEMRSSRLRFKEKDNTLMDGMVDEDLLADDELAEDEALSHEDDETIDSDLERDLEDDAEEMTIVDPLIDKAAREDDDSAQEDDLDDSEFDDDIQFDQLDEFMSEDPEEVDDLVALDDTAGIDDELGDEIDDELAPVLKAPLTASQQALEARRAIEERAERRRMERDLNYLDFELDD